MEYFRCFISDFINLTIIINLILAYRMSQVQKLDPYQQAEGKISDICEARQKCRDMMEIIDQADYSN